ncbi:peptidoglycan DD-metalloendopeptidase family protein [Lacimicrobium alkaliphilum]|uniref:Family M23 zinc metallopeptidase with OapA domain protein n=1 Tax=Lacimicrobium alkaliphilum TaxID=1526571 RepID=A0ABQ1QYZ9_9ALTE|nr:peptidoglycan DD-metalloendopeptidase family protein [Lacimicrobium alkaliphilum]GGD50645.1 family M23 zinc metallopeptidase with OapA domain protein [Lacimicrobium alkaliphilum]
MVKQTVKQLPKPHKLLIVSLALVAVVLFIVPSEPASASRHTAELEPGKRYPLELELEQTSSDIVNDEGPDWQKYRVKRGDNLARIFDRAGLTPQDTYQVSRAGDAAKRLLKMMPGDELQLAKDENGHFLALNYAYSPFESLHIEKNDSEITSSIEARQVDTRLGYASGIISSSFWHSGVAAGLSEAQIMNLAGIFGWDIDFALELRAGDSFNLVYEEEYVDGEFVGKGRILAAEFSNRGETFKAIRYDDGNYYTPEGRSMRKSFLRAPVSFKYISSSFNPRRLHPVLKSVRPHNGIDYAASTGTPVIAAGDGKVVAASYNRYNGNYVFIQHGEKYTTKYLHFSRRAVKKGQSVKQGQVIGYVGATGLASGPHLHYEFLVNGTHRNPRTVKLPKAEPIASSEREKFATIAEEYTGYLDTNRRIMLAMN